jgi:CheY-like chemotaxis protein
MTQEEKDPFAHLKASTHSPYRNLKVLLVEDDDDARTSMKTSLKNLLGCNVIDAASPGEALDRIAIEVDPFSLVITDITFDPSPSDAGKKFSNAAEKGADFLRSLKSHFPKDAAPYVVAMSGWPHTTDGIKVPGANSPVKLEGMDEYWDKADIDRELLSEILDRVLERDEPQAGRTR